VPALPYNNSKLRYRLTAAAPAANQQQKLFFWLRFPIPIRSLFEPRETGYYAWQSGNFMILTEPVPVKPAVAH
jgi:hypothetical protein